MLQQVVLQTATPMVLDIDSVDPDELIIIKSISGLDPADVTLFTGDFARDGGYYQGRRSSGRNPVFNLKLNPDYKNDVEVSDIREMIYSMFFEPDNAPEANGNVPVGLQVTLIDDRKPDRYFVGYTEKLPSDIFSRETTGQVSMLCVDPFLKSVNPAVATDPVGWVQTDITYEGTAKTGVEMTFKVKQATPTMTVDVNNQKMTLTKAFAVNDVVVINTLIGSRKITLNGVDIMAALSPTSMWIQLHKGVNTVKTYGGAANDGKVVMSGYTYRAAWWGI